MPDEQPPIADYALIADGHSVALVSKGGSVDWCCFTSIERESCFGRILDARRGGHCSIAPVGDHEVERRYLEGTLVLETTFRTAEGEARVTDFFAPRAEGSEDPNDHLIRLVDGIRGSVDLRVEVQPRFAYGRVRPWIRQHGEGFFTAIGGDLGLVIVTEVGMERRDVHDLEARFRIEQGQRRRLGIHSVAARALYPDRPDPYPAQDLDRRLEEAVRWWRDWAKQGKRRLERRDHVERSALVIKGLTHEPSGAIAAAATTSLPEQIGAHKNWDYRFSWIRDSAIAVKVMGDLGYHDISKGFRFFIERTTAGSAEEIQPLYGVRGTELLTETTMHQLGGYRGSKPVRIGNRAEAQLQTDVYGELLEVAWAAAQFGQEPDPEYWHLLRSTVDQVARTWEKADRGIWEERGPLGRNFTHSRVMCWVAVDRALELWDKYGRDDAPLEDWRELASTIRHVVEERGYDRDRGVFVRTLGGTDMDAALLLLPRVGFVTFEDERMVRTVKEIRRKLEASYGLLYRHEEAIGTEGAFVACSFWLIECLVGQGEREEAERIYDRVLQVAANDLGLMAEQVDPVSGELLGNFPQGLSHYSHISAAMALERGRGGMAEG